MIQERGYKDQVLPFHIQTDRIVWYPVSFLQTLDSYEISSSIGEQRPTPTFPQLSWQMLWRDTFLPDFMSLTLELHNCRWRLFPLAHFPTFSTRPQFLGLGLSPTVNFGRLSLHWSGQTWQVLGHMLQIFGLGPVWSGTDASSSQSALLLRLGLSESFKMLRINLHDLCSISRPLFTKLNLVVAGESSQTTGLGFAVGLKVGVMGGGTQPSLTVWHQGPCFW